MYTGLYQRLSRHDVPLLHHNFMYGATRTSPARLRIGTACRGQLVLLDDLFPLHRSMTLKAVGVLIIGLIILKVRLIVGLFYLLVDHLIRFQNINFGNRAVNNHFGNVFIILDVLHQVILARFI